MAFMTETRSAAGSLAERFGRVRAAIADRYASYALYRRTFAELQALDDRDLADLGLARADIMAIARETARSR
jgi:uncharacterized protein YjiS (DUF1127 family)